MRSTDGSEGGETYSGAHFAVDLFYGAIIVGAYVAGYYYFEPFKNADGFGESKFKFEIKKAQDVDQRLDDVKGIAEIKDEVKDLIKMIKNT